MRTVSGLLLLGLLLGADAKDAGDPKLQGTWVVDSCVADGKSIDVLKGGKFVFDGGKVKMVPTKGPAQESPITVDSAKTPRTMDMERMVGKKKELELAIYEIKGDELTICIGPMEVEGTFTKDKAPVERVSKPSKRPTEFTSKGAVLVKLKREKK